MNQNSAKRNNNQKQIKKTSKDLYPDGGYGSSGSRNQNNNNFKNDINNYNKQNNNFQSENYKYPNSNQINDIERPLWSYREIKYDENKQPMNSEEIVTQKITKKSNLEQLQENEQKYFNNMRYQKVKVIKKAKKNENIQPKIPKKGPMDDYEQQYNIQNNNYEQINEQNIENPENLNNNINEMNQINNFNENYEQNEENLENMNNEDDEEGEIELAQKDIQDEYDKIIDDNGQNYNNQNMNNNEEKQKEEINNLQNQMQNNDINDEELQKENYDLDIENLAEVNSDNEKEDNKNLQEEQQNFNQNNKMETNQNRPMPTFNETITQKVTDIIEHAKTFPEGNLESWNCVADYTP